MGGLPRRAALIDYLRKNSPNTVVVEYGDFFAGEGKLDRLRISAYLKALKKIGYDAVSIHGSAFLANRRFLEDTMAAVSPPLVSLNALDADTEKFIGRPFIITGADKFNIALVGLTDPLDGSTGRTESPSKGHAGGASEPSPKAQQAAAEAVDQRVKVVDPLEALEKHLPTITAQSDFIIILSALGAERNKEIANRFPQVKVILGTDSGGMSALYGSTFIANNKSEDGKKIGRLSLTVDGKGNLLETGIEWLPIRKTLAEDRKIRSLLDDFYDEVAGNKEFWEEVEPLFASLEIEADAANKYVGAVKCAECHRKIYLDWGKTGHAAAYNTLVKENRYFYPDCISCHTTGAGYPSGFRIDRTTKHLEDVQCEVCHGPGARHVTTDGGFDLRLPAGEEFCRECHNADVSPEFDARYEGMLAKVNHSDVPANLRTHEEKAGGSTSHPNLKALKKTDAQLFERLYEELSAECKNNHLLFECKGKSASGKRTRLDALLENDRDFDSLMTKMIEEYDEGVRSGEKERARYRLKRQSVGEALRNAIEETGEAMLELFVVSYGNHGIKAENLLFKLMDTMPAGDIKMTLHFIASEAEKDASGAGAGDSGRFTSHNGQREVDEDIRQILIQRHYPEKLRNYLLLRNASITKTDWKVCARAAGVDPGEIEWRVANGEGAELLKRDIGLTQSKKITRSPTLLINDEEFLGKFSE